MKKFLKTETSIYVILFGVCVFILLQSPLAPFAKSIIGIDSSVFIYSARQILDGQLIYHDIVDHKGPFLYFIDVMALFIFNRSFIGIWIFEVLSLFVASVMMYRTARFFADKVSSLLAVITSILFLIPLLVGGNLTEEWALPYISIALYIFVDYLKGNKPLSIVRLFILSLTFVLTFMLRANLVAIWGSFGIVLLIKWIVEKRYKELIRNLLFILLFVLLSMLPFFLYFYCKGTLSDAIYLVFKFNMFEYAQNSNMFTTILKTSRYIYDGCIIAIIIAIYMFFRDKTIINGGILLAFVFTTLACSLGAFYQHYFMIFSPLLVISYAYILRLIKETIPKKKYICLFIIFILFNFNVIETQIGIIKGNYSEKAPNSTLEKLKEIITLNTKPTDKILVKGIAVYLYLYSDRICATRFPYTLKGASLLEKYYVKDTEKALPKLIIQGKFVSLSDIYSLDNLLNTKYQLMPTDIENVEIWKLKE